MADYPSQLLGQSDRGNGLEVLLAGGPCMGQGSRWRKMRGRFLHQERLLAPPRALCEHRQSLHHEAAPPSVPHWDTPTLFANSENKEQIPARLQPYRFD